MSKEDLIPCRDSAEAKRRGRNGGLASGEARRKRKALRELVTIALGEKYDDPYEIGTRYTGMANDEVIAARLVSQAAGGNLKAMAMLFNLESESAKNLAPEDADAEAVEKVEA